MSPCWAWAPGLKESCLEFPRQNYSRNMSSRSEDVSWLLVGQATDGWKMEDRKRKRKTSRYI